MQAITQPKDQAFKKSNKPMGEISDSDHNRKVPPKKPWSQTEQKTNQTFKNNLNAFQAMAMMLIKIILSVLIKAR